MIKIIIIIETALILLMERYRLWGSVTINPTSTAAGNYHLDVAYHINAPEYNAILRNYFLHHLSGRIYTTLEGLKTRETNILPK